MAEQFTASTLVSTNPDFGYAPNWILESIRNDDYQWTASGSGTGEYYLRTAAGGDPGITEPDVVQADGADLTVGTAGSLTASTWDWADNDSLGYSTVYVRLSDDANPDTKALGFVTHSHVPNAGDDLNFRHSSGTMAGSDESAVEYADINVLAECTAGAGSSNKYLQLDQGTSNLVTFAGLGTWYLDLGTSGSEEVRVDQTAQAQQGNAGLYFKNETNAITLFICNGGTTRLVAANITTLIVQPGATVYIDKACTIPTVINNGGTVIDYGCGITTWKQNKGTSVKQGADDFALSMYGGTFYDDGTGTCTATQYGGTLDALRDAQTKTVVLTRYGGTFLKGSNTTVTDTLNAPCKITDA